MTERRRILAAGTLALDTVETPSGRVADVPGGSALYFAVAAGLLAPVSVVGVVGGDYPLEDLGFLEQRGVDLSGIGREKGPSFRWSVRYHGSERETLDTNRGVALGRVPHVPSGLTRPWAVFLGSTDPDVQSAVLDQVESARLVVLDTMSHWIRDRREQVEALLARADVLLVNEEETGLLGGTADPAEAVDALLSRGPRWVVVKRSARGASAYGAPGSVDMPAVPVSPVVDPTGAGDAFAGGLVGSLTRQGRLDSAAMERALGAGVRTGALAVSSFSLGGLAAADMEEFRTDA